MANCIQCTETGADTAMNGNTYVCPNCRGYVGALTKAAYESEFVVIDGLNQHKDGLSFYDWLHKHIS